MHLVICVSAGDRAANTGRAHRCRSVIIAGMPGSRTPTPLTVPHAATAQRPDWSDLPAEVRDWVVDQLGAAVVSAISERSGYTPGFAARLVLADGRRVFAKVAGWGREWLLESYAKEAAKRRTLPAGVPAPELIIDARTVIDSTEWQLVIFTEIDGRPPHRPWIAGDIRVAVRAVEDAARALTPAPAGYPWEPLSVELGGLTPDKEQMITERFGDHAGEMRDLVAALPERCNGSTLVHADLRDDNRLIGADGRGWIVDWNFPLLGRPWTDLVTLLISVRGDGWDADAILAASRLVGPDDQEGIDSLLADLALYYAIASGSPEPDGSPYLREHQRWSGAVVADWLAERRHWPRGR